MSDLSAPSAAPIADARAGATDWPSPALSGYGGVQAAVPPACQVEGVNGRLLSGRLLAIDPAQATVTVRADGSRSPLTLRFDQFRRLLLPEPLRRTSPAGPDASAAPPPLPFTVRLRGAPPWSGFTLAPAVRPWGLFLFEPTDDAGSLRRSFVPRQAYDEAELGTQGVARHGSGATADPEAAPGPAGRMDAAQAPDGLPEAAQADEPRQRRLADRILSDQIATADELIAAVEQQATMPMVRIGESLRTLGFVSEAQLQAALDDQLHGGGHALGELLVSRGWITPAELRTALARKMGYPLVDVQRFPVDTEAVARLPYALAARLPALPLLVRKGRLVVAFEDPTQRSATDEVEFATQMKVIPVLARAGTIGMAVEAAYEKMGAEVASSRDEDHAASAEFEPGDASRLAATLEQSGPPEDDDAGPTIEQSDNSLVRLINSMILEAQAKGASDIHVECPIGRQKVRIRFRKDGVLRPYLELPPSYRSAIVARIKIMCDLDISERRKPQDGKIAFGKFAPGSRLELRVATIPTLGGHEDVVLRLLAAGKPLPLDGIGLSPANLERFKQAIHRPHGMLLCVGPTGSGKTTTLHSALSYINTPERKIWTAEDPIEITQGGLRQVQVNPKIDWTFAKALRAFLRADPDVIMVGEIRDRETAQMAIEASLTGHLVLSTLHTNSAAETVTRLLDMGMDPFNFADSLLAVLAQRLVRRLCAHCRTSGPLSDSLEQEFVADHLRAFDDPAAAPAAGDVVDRWRQRFGRDGRLLHWHSDGCESCDGSGLSGRAGLHELMPVSRRLRQMIQTGSHTDDLLRQALAEGMGTLRQDGIEKVLQGVTSIDEVRANS